MGNGLTVISLEGGRNMNQNEFGMLLQNDKYTVEITEDQSYVIDSEDNKAYDFVMNPNHFGRNHWYKTLCIAIEGVKRVKIALLGDCDTAERDCAILEGDILTVLLKDTVMQIDLSSAELVGTYRVDVFGATFTINRMSAGYLIYGEMEILRLDDAFNTVWKFSGKDIFASVTGKNAFELTDHSIRLYDYQDNFYELDFDGNIINQTVKGS